MRYHIPVTEGMAVPLGTTAPATDTDTADNPAETTAPRKRRQSNGKHSRRTMHTVAHGCSKELKLHPTTALTAVRTIGLKDMDCDPMALNRKQAAAIIDRVAAARDVGTLGITQLHELRSLLLCKKMRAAAANHPGPGPHPKIAIAIGRSGHHGARAGDIARITRLPVRLVEGLIADYLAIHGPGAMLARQEARHKAKVRRRMARIEQEQTRIEAA